MVSFQTLDMLPPGTGKDGFTSPRHAHVDGGFRHWHLCDTVRMQRIAFNGRAPDGPFGPRLKAWTRCEQAMGKTETNINKNDVPTPARRTQQGISTYRPLVRPIVLIGLMGAGKTSVGRCLARQLSVAFIDTDGEIELAAGRSIPDIFRDFGEAAFRDGERRVIARLLEESPRVLATGGGAYMDPTTRDLIRNRAVAVWLRAPLDVLDERTRRKSHRPLLSAGNGRETLQRLIDARYPVYAEADVIVDSLREPLETTTQRVIQALKSHNCITPDINFSRTNDR